MTTTPNLPRLQSPRLQSPQFQSAQFQYAQFQSPQFQSARLRCLPTPGLCTNQLVCGKYMILYHTRSLVFLSIRYN